MRFIGNMGISPVTIQFLRSLGHEAKRLLEEHLEKLSDEEILDKARAEGAIILTSDLDFGDLLAASTHELPSVVLFRLGNMDLVNVNRHLIIILEKYARELELGAILSVNERKIRVRKLPITSPLE